MINRIYLSSTFKDLEPFRAAVARAVRRINKEVEGMEEWLEGWLDVRLVGGSQLAPVGRAEEPRRPPMD